MKDQHCVQFLQWALPQLHMSWPGFRKVRRQACKRIGRRMRELGLEAVEDYRAYLSHHASEWERLDAMCRITISRFYRDRGVFAALEKSELPALLQRLRARGGHRLRAWSAGCASGEEPYTLAIMWEMAFRDRYPGVALEIVATDADGALLQRARAAAYGFGSLKDLPGPWREASFDEEGETYRLRAEFRDAVRFWQEDIRERQPEGPFDLVLCRNLVFTYFDEPLQLELLERIAGAMQTGGVLVVGAHEKLPGGAQGFSASRGAPCIYRKHAMRRA